MVTHERTTGSHNHAGVPGPNGNDPVHAHCPARSVLVADVTSPSRPSKMR